MLRSLLTDRLKLTTHIEQQDRVVYVLKTDGTPKVRPNSSDGRCDPFTSRSGKARKVTATHCSLRSVIGLLHIEPNFGVPIDDQTGLTVFYDFEFTEKSPGDAMKNLGLKLEGEWRPIDTIVIDHVEVPQSN